MKYSKLLWLSGNDIPFPEAALVIHCPTIKEIALIGEDSFFIGCHLLNFDKNSFLSDQDKIALREQTNFDILMQVLKNSQASEIQNGINSVTMLLALLFPNAEIEFFDNKIQLTIDNEIKQINNQNFEIFKSILVEMFCLTPLETGKYNPKGDLARKIAEKLEAGRKKIAQQSNQEDTEISILMLKVSILSVGEHKDMNSILNYSIYQLYDEFERFMLKESFDIRLTVMAAGGSMKDEPVNWQQDIHSPEYLKWKKDNEH